MGTMATSENPNEMLHDAPFHQGLQGYFWDRPEPFYEKTVSDRVVLISFLSELHT